MVLPAFTKLYISTAFLLESCAWWCCTYILSVFSLMSCCLSFSSWTEMTFMELQRSVAYRLWKVSGGCSPPLLLTTSPWIVGADGAAGEKGDVGFILAGTEWSRAFLEWMWAAKTLSKGLTGPRLCQELYSSAGCITKGNLHYLLAWWPARLKGTEHFQNNLCTVLETK